jgi:predicted RNA binding protein YcfA (HicA-like mRNA interferase family)
MRLPRDITGEALANSLKRFGYETVRQTGSHIRLTTQDEGEHHLTIPNHSPLKTGTLNAILKEIATHFQISRDDLLQQLFD